MGRGLLGPDVAHRLIHNLAGRIDVKTGSLAAYA